MNRILRGCLLTVTICFGLFFALFCYVIGWVVLLANIITCLIIIVVAASYERIFHHSKITQKQQWRKLVQNGNVNEINSFLIKKGRKWLEWKDNNGETALFWATRKNDLDIVTLLLRQGSDETITNYQHDCICTLVVSSCSTFDVVWKVRQEYESLIDETLALWIGSDPCKIISDYR